MLKNAIVLILVSAAAIFFSTQIDFVLKYLVIAHNKLAAWLGSIFSTGEVGRIILETITLVIVPIVIVAIIALTWFLIRRKEMPHALATTWVIWTVFLVTMLSQHVVSAT